MRGEVVIVITLIIAFIVLVAIILYIEYTTPWNKGIKDYKKRSRDA